MNEHDVMYQVRESFSGLHMDTPVEQVWARSRARRRRRLTGLTAATAATAGAAAVIALTAGGAAPAPARSGHAPSASPGSASQGSVRLAAFTVTNGPGDSTTLVLRKDAPLDPSALRQALAQHGIPALVTVAAVADGTVIGSRSFTGFWAGNAAGYRGRPGPVLSQGVPG